MKRALLLIMAGLGLVVLVLAVNAWRAGAPDHAPTSRSTVELADVDVTAVARHLGEAIRFETISVDEQPGASLDALLDLHAWLESTYPTLHSVLEREIVNGASLLYTWPGADPNLAPVAFLAHMDVVPVDPSTLDAWTHPPFAGAVEGGAVWGRGALDMKSTLVTLMEAVELLTKAGVQPARTVYLALGHDEEVGGPAGAAQIARLLDQRGVRLAWVLDEGGMIALDAVPGIDAPLAMIAVAEKGYLTLEITASAEGGHSSTPGRETAVGRLAQAIVALEAAPFPTSMNDTLGEMIERVGSHGPFVARLVTANRWLFDPLILWAISSDPVLGAMTRTTTAPTMLVASPKENALAQTATATVNFRVIPGETTETVIARVREIVGDDRMEVRQVSEPSSPSPVASTRGESFARLERSIAHVVPDAVVVPGLLMAGTDSHHYVDVADDLYRFAALRIGRSDLSRFHGLDERVPVDTLGPMVQFYVDLIGSGLGAEAP